MFTDRSVLSEISNAKNEMLEPEQYTRINGDFRKEKLPYMNYIKKELKENNAIDFDDRHIRILFRQIQICISR